MQPEASTKSEPDAESPDTKTPDTQANAPNGKLSRNRSVSSDLLAISDPVRGTQVDRKQTASPTTLQMEQQTANSRRRRQTSPGLMCAARVVGHSQDWNI